MLCALLLVWLHHVGNSNTLAHYLAVCKNPPLTLVSVSALLLSSKYLLFAEVAKSEHLVASLTKHLPISDYLLVLS
jgi:hypothetical protein